MVINDNLFHEKCQSLIIHSIKRLNDNDKYEELFLHYDPVNLINSVCNN